MKTKTAPRSSLSSSTRDTIEIRTNHEQQVVIRALERSRSSLTLDAAIQEWANHLAKRGEPRTAQCRLVNVRAWARESKLGATSIAQITDDQVQAWVNRAGPNKLATRKIDLVYIRKLFDFLVIKGLTATNPAALATIEWEDLTHEQKESKVILPFNAVEFDTLTAHLKKELAEVRADLTKANEHPTTGLERIQARHDTLLFWNIAVVISRCAGLRLGDIATLEWKTMEGDHFTVWTGKRNKRVAPYIWNPQLFHHSTGSIPINDTPFCFPNQREVQRNPRKSHLLSTQFGRICTAAKLTGHTFHGLRHTYATECAKSGIATPHIARSLGHSSITTTAGYIH